MPKAQFPKINLTKKAFVEYLTAHPRKQFRTSSTDLCPVAQFIASQIESKKIGVNVQSSTSIFLEYYGERRKRNEDGEWIVEDSKKFAVPAWMSNFIVAFDETKGSGPDNDIITGATLLAAEMI